MSSSEWTHILFIDDLKKLSVEKDSSLQLAISLKELGKEVYLIFEDDFYFLNKGEPILNGYKFEGEFVSGSSYIENFNLGARVEIVMNANSVVHMRLDPPFDSRYTRYLWILKALSKVHGVRVLNDPEGILIHNEKMICYESKGAATSFVGASDSGFEAFYHLVKNSEEREYAGLILKPLDLYQGIGVEKIDASVSFEECLKIFQKKKTEFGGAVVAQPFLKEVESGEIRSIYFNGVELGNIIKIPPKGEFLANIAQGASYESIELDQDTRLACEEMSRELAQKGVPWIAYDILGGVIQEANITCPGLLVEVSKAAGINLARRLAELVEEFLATEE